METIINLNPKLQMEFYHLQMKNALAANDMDLFNISIQKLLVLYDEFIESSRIRTEVQKQENEERIKQQNYKKCLHLVR